MHDIDLNIYKDKLLNFNDIEKQEFLNKLNQFLNLEIINFNKKLSIKSGEEISKMKSNKNFSFDLIIKNESNHKKIITLFSYLQKQALKNLVYYYIDEVQNINKDINIITNDFNNLVNKLSYRLYLDFEAELQNLEITR